MREPKNIRKTLNKEQIEALREFREDEVNENIANRYRLTESEWNAIKYLDSENTSTTSDYIGDVPEDALRAYCLNHKIDYKQVTSAKYINHLGQEQFNIVMKPLSTEEVTVDIKEVLNDVLTANEMTPIQKDEIDYSDTVDRLIYTDTHIAMDTNFEGIAMFATEWNEEVIMNTLLIMCEVTLSNKRSNVLYIDDLGDFMDGWDGETTRGGHKLPQNMNNIQAFKVGLEFKKKMIEYLHAHYDYIVCNNVCNDNHGGHFSYMVNHAFKEFIDVKYSNVMVNNYDKFIDHYFIGRHAIVLSHGKDKKQMKFGFKPMLDSKQIEKIEHYNKHNEKGNIYRNSDFVEFSKGDSHQMLFDWSTAQDFNYMNYPALSPSSEWVSTNFKSGQRGFVIQNINRNKNIISYLPIFL